MAEYLYLLSTFPYTKAWKLQQRQRNNDTIASIILVFLVYFENDLTMISTHVLDTTNGGAGVGIEVFLHKWDETSWNFIQKDVTNADGRAANFVTKDTFTGGTYKLIFKIKEYFQSRGGGDCFFPIAEIVFECVESEHYHVPLLLSRFSYTTYRGK